jgi:hypothetical protein
MKTLPRSLLLPVAVLAFIAACGHPTELAETLTSAVAISPPTTSPSSEAPIAEPTNCLPDFIADQGVCRQAHSVSLTAIAAASSNLTIFAGSGQQPLIEVYVDPNLLAYDTTVRLQISAGQAFVDGELDQVNLDSLGFFYSYRLLTQALPEGTYQLRAWVLPGLAGGQQDGVPSETLTLVVDRTPPDVTATLSGLPSGPVPRNFAATATVGAISHTGMAIAGFVVRALGPAAPVVLDPPDPWANFATVIQHEDLPPNIATAESFISGTEIPNDTAGLDDDASNVLLQVSGTDVLGNVGMFELLIPIET